MGREKVPPLKDPPIRDFGVSNGPTVVSYRGGYPPLYGGVILGVPHHVPKHEGQKNISSALRAKGSY